MPVVLLDAVRSPLGAVHGAFSERHPVELLAAVLRAIADRTPAVAAAAHEVLVGCVEQVGAQGGDVARAAVLAAGWPVGAGGTTLDRGAVSGIAALAHATALVAAGATPVAIAAAVDLPSLVPAGAAAMGRYPYGRPWEGVAEHHRLLPPGRAAEQLAIERARQDAWAARSLERAEAAIAAGRFGAEIVPVDGATADEVPATRAVVVADAGSLPPIFDDDGTVTAANTAPAADGAAAVVLADAGWAQEHDYEPLAVVTAVELRSGIPADLVGAAADAVAAACRTAAMHVAAIDSLELPESHGAVAVALADLLGLAARPDAANPDGGALALGDPTATSALRAAVTLAHRLRRADLGTGLAVAAGLGEGAALVLRRPSGITSM